MATPSPTPTTCAHLLAGLTFREVGDLLGVLAASQPVSTTAAVADVRRLHRDRVRQGVEAALPGAGR